MRMKNKAMLIGTVLAAVSSTAFGEDTPNGSKPSPSSSSWMEIIDFNQLLESNNLNHWLILLVAIVLGITLGKVVSFVLERLTVRLNITGWSAYSHVFSGMIGPVTLASFTAGLGFGLAQISMSPALRQFCGSLLLLFSTVAGFWYAFNLVGAIEVGLQRFAKRTETQLDDQLVPVIRKALRIFIVVIGSLFILQNIFDRDIGAWLAGLGIAGLAVSLAAQDSLKNLFDTFTILFDQPFSIGQRIRFDKFDGTIEGIGFRSTRIRTLEGHQVTIPNSNIVNSPVENVALRQSLRRIFSLSITYDTPVAQVRQAVQIARDLLASPEFRGPVHDPDTAANADPPRVYFDEFRADSLNIKVHYWYRPVDWWAYMDHAERFNLALMEAFEKAGIEFAFPTQTLFLAGDPKRALPLTTATPPPSHIEHASPETPL